MGFLEWCQGEEARGDEPATVHRVKVLILIRFVGVRALQRTKHDPISYLSKG